MTLRSRLARAGGVLGLLVLLGNPASLVAATPEQKCMAAKAKAFGGAVAAQARCQATAREKDAPVDLVCLAKVKLQVAKRLAKAEKVGACPVEAAVVDAAVARCVVGFDGATAGSAPCVARKIKAAGAKAAAKAACIRKATLKGIDKDQACLDKVETTFAAAVAKADRKGTCTGTVDALEALVDACLGSLAEPPACEGGTGFPTCDGTCPAGRSCRPYEVFEDGTSTETGCSCVNVVDGPECSGDTCGPDRHCADPTEVCERWLEADGFGCDRMVCQPAMTTPTTLPPDDKIVECDGGEFPTCGGTCATGLRCQGFQAIYTKGTTDISFFAGCVCVDPRTPRCELSAATCDVERIPFTHCADPSKVCLVTLVGSDGDNITCGGAHCGDPRPVILPPTTVTSTSTSTTTTTTSTTSTSTSVPCVSTPGTSGCFTDLGDCTILDTCTGFQWEKKSEVPGSLNDVNARYAWSGCCERDCSTVETHCQPNAGASATCFALADGAEGCGLCATGSTCYVDSFGLATTTVWDWLNQLNAYGFAGHHDWRLARESGFNPGPNELETILLMPHPCTTDPLPCIDPIFGPTMSDIYWSATTKGATGPGRPNDAWFVDFLHGNYGDSGKWGPLYVRAVRNPE
jgi:hypothetical protein